MKAIFFARRAPMGGKEQETTTTMHRPTPHSLTPSIRTKNNSTPHPSPSLILDHSLAGSLTDPHAQKSFSPFSTTSPISTPHTVSIPYLPFTRSCPEPTHHTPPHSPQHSLRQRARSRAHDVVRINIIISQTGHDGDVSKRLAHPLSHHLVERHDFVWRTREITVNVVSVGLGWVCLRWKKEQEGEEMEVEVEVDMGIQEVIREYRGKLLLAR